MASGFWHQVGRYYGSAFWGTLTVSGFAFLIFLIPGVDFISSVLGGSVQNLDVFLSQVLQALGSSSGQENLGTTLGAVGYLVATMLELALFHTYPISWTLFHRPDDGFTILISIAPWLIGGFLSNLKLAKNWKEAIGVGIYLMIHFIIIAVIFIVLIGAIPAILGSENTGGAEGQFIGGLITSILNGIALGATDMDFGASTIFTTIEGIGFFIGTGIIAGLLKESKGGGVKKEKKGKKDNILRPPQQRPVITPSYRQTRQQVGGPRQPTYRY
ncbi:MAG: hypothetical protein ACTSRA_01455 [Promethearchaeota archaeon]